MHNRTLKEVLADHNIQPMTETERNVIRWKHLRASTAYPRYFINRYSEYIFKVFIFSLISGFVLLVVAGITTVLNHQIASIVAMVGLSLLVSAAAIFVITIIIDGYTHERPAYWNQRLDHTDETDRKHIPDEVLQHIDSLTHPMGSGVKVSIEGDSTMFCDCVLVHNTCWVSVNNPLQIEAIASWEVAYKVPDSEAA